MARNLTLPDRLFFIFEPVRHINQRKTYDYTALGFNVHKLFFIPRLNGQEFFEVAVLSIDIFLIITYNNFTSNNKEEYMDRAYLTVERISELLDIHPKTIQRYIREGKLRAVKVGKSWRVSGHDLSVFIESNSAHGEKSNAERTITASSVIDIGTNGAEDAMRIINLLTSALNAKPPGFSKTSMQSQYIERENIVRVTFWGDIRLMSVIVEMIINITGSVLNES